MNLSELLHRAPVVWSDLEHAHVVRVGDSPEVRAPSDPRTSTPGNLEVIEHRHALVTRLRWWVDAVKDPDADTPPVGDSVGRMCLFLVAHTTTMAPEDRDELNVFLGSWIGKAWRLMDPAPLTAKERSEWRLPPKTPQRIVPVHVAAALLAVSPRTIQRRVAPEDRPNGQVKLEDALIKEDLCTHDLWVRCCTECVAGPRQMSPDAVK